MIQIIRGVYGYLDKDGIVRPMTESDPPFSLLPEQEARLVRLGVAEYVGQTPATEEPVEDEPAVEEAIEVEIPLTDYSVKELRELGKEYGLTFKVGATKADMVRAIEAAEAELEEVEEDDEDAPVFDASQAVQ